MKEKYESPLSSRYASDYMLNLFSADKRIQTWRKLWVAALERARANATDDYVKTFCRQQLDLCR